MASPDPARLQVRYRYLLFRKDGSVCPLVAVEDLPTVITVIPPLDMIGGITLVQEITKSSTGTSPGLSGDQVPANDGQKVGENDDDENDEIGSTPSGPLHTCLSQGRKTHMCAIPGPNTGLISKREEETPDNERYYLHPNHSQAKLQNGNSSSLLPEVLTARESRLKASGLFRKDICQSFFRDAVCKWGVECTFRHEAPLRPEKWQKANCVEVSDVPGPSEDARCRHETDEDPDNQCSSDGGEVASRSGMTTATSNTVDGETCGTDGKGKKTEFCAYFHRKVGCKRGKDCFYIHESEPGSSTSERYICLKRGNSGSSGSGSPTNPKKMEGGWRRVASPTSETNEEEKKTSSGPSPTVPTGGVKLGAIACPTPGRIPSSTNPLKHIKTHCTFFLRFGECDYWPSCKFSHERPVGLATPPSSPTPVTNFTRWRSSRASPGSAEKPDTGGVKKILTRDDGNGEIPPSPSPNMECLVGGRFSFLERIPNGDTLQKTYGGISETGENGLAIAEGQLITLAE